MLGAQEREQGEDLATVCASELLCQRNILSEGARVVVAHMRSVPHTHTYIRTYILYLHKHTKCEAGNDYALPGLSRVNKRTAVCHYHRVHQLIDMSCVL